MIVFYLEVVVTMLTPWYHQLKVTDVLVVSIYCINGM